VVFCFVLVVGHNALYCIKVEFFCVEKAERKFRGGERGKQISDILLR